MKKIAVILLLLFCVPTLRAQKNMTFHLSDGTILSFLADSIKGIGFIDNSAQNRQYVFTLHPDTAWGQDFPYRFPLGIGDSIWLSHSNDSLLLDVAQWSDAGFAGLIGVYHASAIDSINVVPRFPQPLDTNYNVVEFPAIGVGRFYCTAWANDIIYAGEPLYYFDIDSDYNIIQDSEIDGSNSLLYLAINRNSNRLLETSGIDHASSVLNEIQLDSEYKRVRISSESNISSALYFGNGNDSIIFYTYGTSDSNAGYYLFDRNSGKETLILKYLSNLGPGEMVNGFDISPDGKKLLVPVARQNQEPIAFEFDMTTGQFDTLNINFDSTEFGVRPSLWLRYNHDGTQILYDNYPANSYIFGQVAGNLSEIGIIDRKTFTKRVLRTNPSDIYVGISLMPEWSPDESKIIYGCSPMFEDGEPSYYRICILTTLQ